MKHPRYLAALALTLLASSCASGRPDSLTGAASAVREPASPQEVWRAAPRGSAARVLVGPERGPERPFRAGPRELPGH